MHSELFDSFLSIRRLRDQLHVRFGAQQGRNALAQEGMIIAHENSDRFSCGRHNLLPCEVVGMEGYHSDPT